MSEYKKGVVGDLIRITNAYKYHDWFNGREGEIVEVSRIDVNAVFDDGGSQYFHPEEYELIAASNETAVGSHSFLDAGETPNPHNVAALDAVKNYAVKNYHVSIAADGLDVLCDKATNDQVSRIIEILLEESA